MTTTFKNLGAGIGFRPCHYHEILASRPKAIRWLEIISENFMSIGGRPRDVLEQAASIYPIAMHGVGLSIGSRDPIPSAYLKNLKSLVTWVKPALISDHLCFTTHNSHNSHDLLPIPFTRQLLDRISDRLKFIQDLLGTRFMLENPSAYVAYAENDMSESEFFAALIEKTGCGMLLDVNNLFVNQMNLGVDPLEYIQVLPTHAIGQIHLAGHSIEDTEDGTVRIDTHDHPIPEEVWLLFKSARAKWPEASAMVEWDDHIPPLNELLPLLERISMTDGQSSGHIQMIRQGLPQTAGHNAEESVLATFFAMATDPEGIKDDDQRLDILEHQAPVSRSLGMHVYNNAYFARLRDVLKDEFSTLSAVTTDEGFSSIASAYLIKNPPYSASVSELGRRLPGFLRSDAVSELENIDFGVSLAALADIAALDDVRSQVFCHPSRDRTMLVASLGEITPNEWDQIHFEWNESVHTLATEYDIAPVWAVVQEPDSGEPHPPAKRSTNIRIWRQNHIVHHQVMSDQESQFFSALRQNSHFADATKHFAAETNCTVESATEYAVTIVVQWIQQGLIAGIQLS